jgi:hypothetical protein
MHQLTTKVVTTATTQVAIAATATRYHRDSPWVAEIMTF